MRAFEEEIISLLKIATGLPEIKLEVPPNPAMGDYAFACFTLSKEQKKSPLEIAKGLAATLPKSPALGKILATGPYVNFFLNKLGIAKQILTEIFERKEDYGKQPKNGKTVVVEFSSPNIAKPFGIGHLRSTVIGNSIAKLYYAVGYNVHAVNHLGDWGTPHGKLIVAYKLWGDEKELERDPIAHLYHLYVKFNAEEEKNDTLKEEARQWFKKLEDGDKEAVKLWELFREVSLQEFQKIYHLLSVKFDSHHGEAFYTARMPRDLANIQKLGITEESEGALIVDLSDINVPPLMLQKKDGATTYHMRDLSAALYRLETYSPEKIIYVVGTTQQLHFKQLFTVLGMIGHPLSSFEHVGFGQLLLPEGKMSTRKGNLIFLEDVLDKSIALALDIIEKKNPQLANKDQVSRWVGIGAVIFGDLINDRIKDITFTWEKILSFEGETGPYLQYTHARACSILRKAGEGVSPNVDFGVFSDAAEHNLIVQLGRFPSVIEESAKAAKPHILAHYLIDLAQHFNEFYHRCPVICDIAQLQHARLLLVHSVAQVLKNGLDLLGLHAPAEM